MGWLCWWGACHTNLRDLCFIFNTHIKKNPVTMTWTFHLSAIQINQGLKHAGQTVWLIKQAPGSMKHPVSNIINLKMKDQEWQRETSHLDIGPAYTQVHMHTSMLMHTQALMHTHMHTSTHTCTHWHTLCYRISPLISVFSSLPHCMIFPCNPHVVTGMRLIQ